MGLLGRVSPRAGAARAVAAALVVAVVGGAAPATRASADAIPGAAWSGVVVRTVEERDGDGAVRRFERVEVVVRGTASGAPGAPSQPFEWRASVEVVEGEPCPPGTTTRTHGSGEATAEAGFSVLRDGERFEIGADMRGQTYAMSVESRSPDRAGACETREAASTRAPLEISVSAAAAPDAAILSGRAEQRSAVEESGGTTRLDVVEWSLTRYPDDDADGVPNLVDNCAEVDNVDQRDGDEDGAGDACPADPPQGRAAPPAPPPAPAPEAEAEDELGANTLIERALAALLLEAAEHGDHPRPTAVACEASDAFTWLEHPWQTVDEQHECSIERADGSTDAWCVLSDAGYGQLATLADTCAAKAREWHGRFMFQSWDLRLDDRTNAWGWHAYDACLRANARWAEALLAVDEEEARRSEAGEPPDFTLVWRARRTVEVGILAAVRRIPHRTPQAEKLLARLADRVAAIDRGVAHFRAGREERALAEWDALHGPDPELRRVGAESCAFF